MPPEAGTIGEQGVVLPPSLPLTSERLERHGLFLIEDGQTMFLWIGRDAVPQLVQDVFDLPNYEALRGGKVRDSFRRLELANLILECAHRPLFAFLKTPSHSVLTQFFKRFVRCAEAFTIPICISSRMTANLPFVYGH